VAYVALEGFGADVIRRGTMIAAENGSFAIDVAAPCSGLRSLFALMALTAAYAYLSQRTWPRRALLFALSIPIAIAGNVMRILSICLVAAVASSEFATGFYHDYSGYVVFLVAIVLMVSAGEIISRYRRKSAPADSAGGDGEKPTADSPGLWGWTLSVVFALALSAAMAVLSSSSQPTLAEPSAKRLKEIAPYTSQSVGPSEAEINILPKDTQFDKRIYTGTLGENFNVSMVIGGRSKSSIHRPELCLPTQGFLMQQARTATIGGVTWRIMKLSAGVSLDQYFAYTFYNQEGFRTASHTQRILRDIIDRSLYNRIDRWVLLSVSASDVSEGEFESFLSKLEEVVE
jgi:exosortase/archaeosortase family protein